MSAPKRFPTGDVPLSPIADVVVEASQAEDDKQLAVVRVVAGRVMARRDMGKLMFLDLVDRSGRIQLIVHKEDVEPIDVDLGDIIGVYGAPGKSRRHARRVDRSTAVCDSFAAEPRRSPTGLIWA